MSRLTREALIEHFHAHAKVPSRFRIGAEWEKEALTPDGRRLPFFGDGGVQDVLRALVERFGWTPRPEGEHLVALERDGDTITLEPGAQVETSLRPLASVAEVEAGLRRHLAELHAVTPPSITWSSLGFTPFQDIAEIPWVPKARYGIMGPYLARRGRLGHHMMKGTTSIQASFDYSSEADCARKLQASLALSPVATALFAHSPLAAGRPAGAMSFRALTWRETDPDRCGLLEDVVDASFTFERWVDYMLDVPMMFLKVHGRWHAAEGMPFRTWMERGFLGEYPDLDQWELHLTSVFPEVRLKRYVEIRSCDNVPFELLPAMPALWKGLLYDEVALGEALDLAASLPGPRERLGLAAATDGLRGEWGARSLGDWARDLVDIAERGLGRQAAGGDDERRYLEPLRRRLDRDGGSPAEDAVAAWSRTGGDVTSFLEAIAYPRD